MGNECKNDRNPNWPASVKLKSLLISFRNTISRKEIESFRGAVVNAMENANVLFHNHEADGRLRYAYPLIQYKRIHQKAAILCLGEGTEAVGEFFAACQFDVKLGERETTLEIESVKANQSLVQIWDSLFTYRIRRWLPLNQENYETYMNLSGLVERCSFLESMLKGNLLSFASGIGLYFEQQVECHITELSTPYAEWYKGTKLMAFDAEFRCNVSLPDFVGLGKGVSVGMGTVESIDNKENTK